MADSELLIELQNQLSFQDDTITQLNDVVARQQQDIIALQRDLEFLRDQVQGLVRMQVEMETDVQDQPPPHY